MAKRKKRKPLPKCETGKRPFTKDAAMRAVARALLDGRDEQRSYQCEFCGWWHLTSQDKRRAV